MVRIEFKKVAEGRIVLGMEVEDETPADVVMCALRGFVGVARRVLDKKSEDPWFAKQTSRILEEMLLGAEDIKVTRGAEGKEAEFMAALLGMNAGGEK